MTKNKTHYFLLSCRAAQVVAALLTFLRFVSLTQHRGGDWAGNRFPTASERRERGRPRYLEGGEGVRGDVEGGHLHVVEEAVEVIRVEDDLGERLVADALPQHDPAIQRYLGRLVPSDRQGVFVAPDWLASHCVQCVCVCGCVCFLFDFSCS